jgi:hypothetical protein
MPENRTGRAETAADLKRRAAQARRLAMWMNTEADQNLLREFAEELEARAAELDNQD